MKHIGLVMVKSMIVTAALMLCLPLTAVAATEVAKDEAPGRVMAQQATKIKELWITTDLDAPKGVNGRNSDNTLIEKYLGWEPSIRLRDGMEQTYAWIHDQYVAREAQKRSPNAVR